jgi:SurA N-terminal domain/PPIC-type PPIASE domain
VGAKSGQSKKSAGSGQAKRLAGSERLVLIAFGALLVLLFAGFAIAQGIGQPSVPSGDVATVKGVPSDISNVSEAEYKRALAQQEAAQEASGKLKAKPKPGTKEYEELQSATLGELLESIWLKGEAEELGISVTDKQIATELAQIKKTSFPTAAKYQEFLKSSHFTQADVNARVELQLLSTQIQEKIKAGSAPASSSEIAENYDETKATAFTTKPSRDVRIIVNKSKPEIEKALEQLEKDNSPASWKKVAAKFSSDPTTKTTGGLQKGLTEELLASAGPLKTEIFGAATGELIGPVNFQGQNLVVEVVKLNPEKVKSLGEVRSQISSQLTQQKQEAVFSEFVSEFQSKWQSRTYCASGFVIERCANFKSSGHPASAPPACYEANPASTTKKGEKPAPLECPAPVEQTKPALPGTVTILKPGGEPFVQRPYPKGGTAAAGAAAAAAAAGSTEVPAETGK